MRDNPTSRNTASDKSIRVNVFSLILSPPGVSRQSEGFGIPSQYQQLVAMLSDRNISLPAQDDRSPCQAAADGLSHHKIARLDLAARLANGQGKRD